MPNTWLSNAIVAVYNTGFFDYALPFMVAFVIIYGILQKTNLFGKGNKRLSVFFAAVVSLIIMPFAANLNYVPYASKLVLVIVAVFALTAILGLLGYRFDNKKNAIIFALLAIAVIIGTEFFDVQSFIASLSRGSLYAIIGVIVFLIIAWSIARPTTSTEQARAERREGRKVAQAAESPYDVEHVKRIPGSELEKEGQILGKKEI